MWDNKELENLNKQIRMGDVISVLMAQSTKLIEIVNANTKEINRLNKERKELEVHTDNATDQLDDDGDKYRDADIMIHQ